MGTLVAPLLVIKKLSYELYVRLHQGLALLVAMSLWLLLFYESQENQIFLATGLGILCATSFTTITLFFRQNRILSGLPKVRLMPKGAGVQATLVVPGTVKIQVGQYISICVPFTGLLSVFQWHPFVVIDAWQEGEQMELTLLINPRRGFTSKLPHYINLGSSYTSLMVGPFGMSLHIEKYAAIVMVASGTGIWSHLPYLRHLTLADGRGKGYLSRAFLLWQLKDIRKSCFARGSD